MMKLIDYNKIIKSALIYASNNLKIEVPTIKYWEKVRFKNKYSASMFLPNEYSIVFNCDWLSEAKIEDLLVTCFHEARHAFQWNVINKYIISAINHRVIKIWRMEFFSYLYPNTSNRDVDYEIQEIERDAIEYAKNLLKEMIMSI